MSPPSRRDLLASSTALLPFVAGCTGNEADGYASPSPTNSGPGTTTPPPGECSAPDLPSPETGEGLPDARSYPERPDDLTMASVSEFLGAFEAAYTYNRTLAEVAADGDCLERLNVDVTGTSVSPAGEGYRATIEYFGTYTGTSCPGVTGTDTPTPLPHSDFPGTARYFVTDRFLVREGAVLACWSGGQ